MLKSHHTHVEERKQKKWQKLFIQNLGAMREKEKKTKSLKRFTTRSREKEKEAKKFNYGNLSRITHKFFMLPLSLSSFVVMTGINLFL
jgi:hypothetical protein